MNGEVKYLLRSRAGARFPIAFFVEPNTHVRQHYYGSCFIILNFDLRFHVAQLFHSEIRCNGSSTVCLLSLAKNRDHLMVLTSSQCQQETGLTHENGWMNKYLTPLSQSAARQSLSNKVFLTASACNAVLYITLLLLFLLSLISRFVKILFKMKEN